MEQHSEVSEPSKIHPFPTYVFTFLLSTWVSFTYAFICVELGSWRMVALIIFIVLTVFLCQLFRSTVYFYWISDILTWIATANTETHPSKCPCYSCAAFNARVDEKAKVIAV